MHLTLLILAQRNGQTAAEKFREMAPWLGVLFVVVLVGGVFILWLRNRMAKDDAVSDDLGFTLADLRKLRDRGELSAEEFEVAKNRMTRKLKENMDRQTDALGRAKKPQNPGGQGVSG